MILIPDEEANDRYHNNEGDRYRRRAVFSGGEHGEQHGRCDQSYQSQKHVAIFIKEVGITSCGARRVSNRLAPRRRLPTSGVHRTGTRGAVNGASSSVRWSASGLSPTGITAPARRVALAFCSLCRPASSRWVGMVMAML